VQTFNEPSRKAVNRTNTSLHGAKQIEESLHLVSKYYSGNFSVDLITGLPFQNKKIVLDDIKKIMEFNPAHVSLYSLSVESGTPLEKNNAVLPDCDFADSLWLSGRQALLNEGFEHYEISNFAKPGKQSVHNMRYWQMLSWIGAGPAASGTIVCKDKEIFARRYTFNNDVDGYIKDPSILKANYEKLNKSALLRESLLMGFRCKEGPYPQIFLERFGCTVQDCIGQTLERWKDKDKMLFLNQFLSEAFDELDSINK